MSITIALLIITGLISYQGFNNRQVIDRLKHYPIAEHQQKEYYRLLSSGFVHGNMTHLIVNAIVLYSFGTQIEQQFVVLFGPLKGLLVFLIMYLSAIVVADLPTYFRHKNDPSYAAVGASGATSAIALIYCLFYPWSWLGLFFIIPIPAIIFAILYLVYSSWADKNRSDGIGHSAHLYGAIYGIVFMLVIKFSVVSVFFNRLMQGPTWPPPGFG